MISVRRTEIFTEHGLFIKCKPTSNIKEQLHTLVELGILKIAPGTLLGTQYFMGNSIVAIEFKLQIVIYKDHLERII